MPLYPTFPYHSPSLQKRFLYCVSSPNLLLTNVAITYCFPLRCTFFTFSVYFFHRAFSRQLLIPLLCNVHLLHFVVFVDNCRRASDVHGLPRAGATDGVTKFSPRSQCVVCALCVYLCLLLNSFFHVQPRFILTGNEKVNILLFKEAS